MGMPRRGQGGRFVSAKDYPEAEPAFVEPADRAGEVRFALAALAGCGIVLLIVFARLSGYLG